MSEIPQDLLYTREHEWVQVSGDKAHIGITAHAQKELGDVVFVEMPQVDQACSASDQLGTIESVKAVAEVYAPVSGKVTAVNGEVQDDPELLNTDPYGEGWLIEIQMTKPSEVNELMSAKQYEDYLAQGEA